MPKTRMLVVLLGVLVATCAIVTVCLNNGRTHTQVSAASNAASVAAAFGYPYPMRCLKITISGAFARAHVIRSGGCARYRGYLNATFHFLDDHWRLVLDEGQLFVPNALLVGTR
jgi:hypothetical protein